MRITYCFYWTWISYCFFWTQIARIKRISCFRMKDSWDSRDSCSTFNIQHYKKMDLRSYTKQELALLYFPDSDPDVARAHLMRWIVRCTQLYEQLLKSGYTKNSKEFNPLQVSYIFFHLGEPWYLSVIIVEYRGATLSNGELGMRNVVSLHCDSERRTLTINT